MAEEPLINDMIALTEKKLDMTLGRWSLYPNVLKFHAGLWTAACWLQMI